ncbi:MAG: UDP-N-acetylmuramoyl-L-alanine--D-glutamate ligase [Butyrivibrio sp.]
MELRDKKVTVIGTGISGMGAVRLLSVAGAIITLYDGNKKLDVRSVRDKLPSDADKDGISIVIGDMPQKVVDNTELLVISPGVPVDCDAVKLFEDKGIPVWGEIELAYNFDKGTVFAITGTNGKTTTTTLVGEIMKAYNPETFVVGNIGTSYTGEVLKTTQKSVTVAEISSFQLETVHDFKPLGSAILNITPDHLDRHHTMENYVEVKESITRNQDGDGFCVLNYDDEELRRFGESIDNAVWFSRKNRPEKGAYLEDGIIRYTDGNNDYKVIDVKDMKLFGNHNYENVMAAVAMTINAGVPLDIITSAIKEFKGVEHRIEFVRTLNGVTYYNDSKGTNPDSSIKAVEAMSGPTVIIAGGYDKHLEFDSFIESFGGKIKLMVLMGATAGQLEETAVRHGFTSVAHANDLREAVRICADNAEDGDAVLLSPACASWDMFPNYEERGRLFKEYVNEL